MKFKLGDRVVVLADQHVKDFPSGDPLYPRGEVFEISPRSIVYNEAGYDNEPKYFKDSDRMYVVKECDLELEDIYNSPLYKALK